MSKTDDRNTNEHAITSRELGKKGRTVLTPLLHVTVSTPELGSFASPYSPFSSPIVYISAWGHFQFLLCLGRVSYVYRELWWIWITYFQDVEDAIVFLTRVQKGKLWCWAPTSSPESRFMSRTFRGDLGYHFLLLNIILILWFVNIVWRRSLFYLFVSWRWYSPSYVITSFWAPFPLCPRPLRHYACFVGPALSSSSIPLFASDFRFAAWIALSFLSHHLPLPSILRQCHPLPLYSMFFFVATSVTLLIPSESRCSFPDLYTPEPFCSHNCGLVLYSSPSFVLLSDIHYHVLVWLRR